MASPVANNKETERPSIIIESDLDAYYAYIVALELQKELASDTQDKLVNKHTNPVSRVDSKKDLKRNVSFKDTVEIYIITPISLEHNHANSKIGEAFIF